MKTTDLPKIGLPTLYEMTAKHYVVFLSRQVVVGECQYSSSRWYQLRRELYGRIDDVMCKKGLIKIRK